MRKVLSILLVAVLLAGCAGVPDSGEPVPIPNRTLRQDAGGGPDVNAALVEPRPGGAPVDTITLFLDAARSTQNPNTLGELFLTPSGREDWKDLPNEVLILRPTDTQPAGDATETNASITINGTVIGRVTDQGVYQAEDPPIQYQETVRLVKSTETGSWLFEDPPDRVIVREVDFDQAFRPVTLYFAALGNDAEGGQNVLVPEQRFLDQSIPPDGLTSRIVRLVMAGASPWLKPVTRATLPAETALRGNVTVVDGDILVDMSAPVESAAAQDINTFAAQVGWSLRPYQVGALRLLVNGRQLAVSGVESVQAPALWTSYNPASRSNAPLYYISGGRLARLDEFSQPETSEEVDKLGGDAAKSGVLSAALSNDDAALAIVKSENDGRQALWIGPKDGPLKRTSLVGRAVSRPTWGYGSDSALVTVDGALWQVPKDGQPARVKIQEPVANAQILAIRLSLDGVRLAFIARSGSTVNAYVGLLQPATNSGPPVLKEARTMSAAIPQASDIGWASLTHVVVVGQDQTGAAAVQEAAIDRSSDNAVPTTGLRAQASTVAAVPLIDAGPYMYIAAGGQLYQRGQRSWTPQIELPEVQAPFYPG